jgi:hypothetical protein
MSIENLTILQKWEDMAAYAYVAVKNYPKSERHTLAAQTVNALLDAGAAMQRAGLVGDRAEKKFLIEEADRCLNRMKIMIRLGVRLGFMPTKKWEILCGQLAEIGKMLGGWLKQSSGRGKGYD